MMEERANENREMTVVLSYVKQRGASAFMRFKGITKETGSIHKSTRERVDSRWAPGSNYHRRNITKLTFRALAFRQRD